MNFLPVRGYESIYEVSDMGEIRASNGKLLELTPHKDVSYLTVTLVKKNIKTILYVHRLVAIAHLPNPANLSDINHKNGIYTANWKDNLEWSMSTENSQYVISTGLQIYTNRITNADFIEYLLSVTEGEYKIPLFADKVRAIAKTINPTGELNEALFTGVQTNGTKNHHTHHIN